MNWGEFFHMGGYALYVWFSYGISLGLMVFMVVYSFFQHRRLKHTLYKRLQRQRGDT